MTETQTPQPNSPGDDAAIGRAFRASLIVLSVVLVPVMGMVGIWFLYRAPENADVTYPTIAPEERRLTKQAIPKLPLTDITNAAGIDFRHESGRYGDKLLPETMGSGVVVFDFNNDTHADLFFVNSQHWAWSPVEKPLEKTSSRLYAGDGSGSFTDVSEDAGIDFEMYAMGAAAGDIDNDGDRDLFITAVGHNRLLRNENGRFVDITKDWNAGGLPEDWNTSCAFVDYNNDGWLDLFVCNYVRWNRQLDLSQKFTLDGQSRAYGPPRAFAGSFNTLLRNESGRGFVDVSHQAGIQVRNPDTGVPLGKAMGIAPVDVNRDGWLDLIIANDTVHNFLFINDQNGSFTESSVTANIAFDRDGTARGAMGIDTTVFRDDGTIAVGIGNFANEASALYLTKPERGYFVDAAMFTGFGPPTRRALTFGMFFFDIDLDGRPDVFGANGHLEQDIAKTQNSQTYAQSPQLFWNAGPEASSELLLAPEDSTGADFTRPVVGRGAAFGDFDSDGDQDLVLTTSGGRPRLFRNDQSLGHHYVRLRLVGTRANRDAIGAVVQLETPRRVLTRVVMPTKSYLSQSELPVTFGLGEETEVLSLRIQWPGEPDFVRVESPAVGRLTTITQGS